MSPSEPWFVLAPPLLFLAWLIFRWVAAFRAAAPVRREVVVYQEWFASGSSQRNLLTKLGGANNCLRLVVSANFLWVTGWLPFGLLASVYDLEHVIPLGRIQSVVRSRILWREALLLSYADERGVSHSLRLVPRRRERFIEALRLPPDKLVAGSVDV